MSLALGNGFNFKLLCVEILILLFSNTSIAIKVQSNISLTTVENAYLDGDVFIRIEKAGVKMCAKTCFRATNCSSFNFNKKHLNCQLLVEKSESPNPVEGEDFLYSTKDTWTGVGGQCEKEPCIRPYEMCVERKEKRFCIKSECMSFPEQTVRHTVDIQSTTADPARSVGNVFTYVCKAGFKMYGPGNITCQPNLSFTTPDPASTCYRVYGDWVLVTRFTRGIGVNARVTWYNVGMNSDNDTDVEDECFSVMANAACTHHYRSGLLDKWQTLGVQEVKVALYVGGVEQAYIIFDGVGTTYTDWFKPSKIKSSSWNDVNTAINHQMFTLPGLSGQVTRSFVISQFLNACTDDLGWLNIIEASGFCAYDKLGTYPYFIFSSKDGVSNQQTEISTADVFAVLLKTSNFP